MINQRRDIDMGSMPTQLIPGTQQISVSGPATCRATKHTARSLVAMSTTRAGRARATFAIPNDFRLALGLVFDLARLFAVLC
jgi:hypothetical protein